MSHFRGQCANTDRVIACRESELPWPHLTPGSCPLTWKQARWKQRLRASMTMAAPLPRRRSHTQQVLQPPTILGQHMLTVWGQKCIREDTENNTLQRCTTEAGCTVHWQELHTRHEERGPWMRSSATALIRCCSGRRSFCSERSNPQRLSVDEGNRGMRAGTDANCPSCPETRTCTSSEKTIKGKYRTK